MLERELQFYEEHRSELLAIHPTCFALIKGSSLIGAFATLEEAYGEGIERFGNVPVLIRQVLPLDPAHELPAFTQGLVRGHS